jgi:hypothetical protein
MSGELVFTVDGATATRAAEISLSEAGLLERSHLQEWVLAHPQILGDDVLIVTFEFDHWQSSSGQLERDRLDVLGLDKSGRLVVAELKRDQAPEAVTIQAIKYAAMASRFTPEVLASQHARFLRDRGQSVNVGEALDRLTAHVESELSVELLRRPRIILVAAGFPATVTATAVWLSEMGIDLSLVKFVAYRTSAQILLTVSRLYPVPDVEEFTVAPLITRTRSATPDYPEIEWSVEDFRALRGRANATTLAALNLCAARRGELVSIREIESEARRTYFEARGDLSALTNIVKRQFGRANWPFEKKWGSVGHEAASRWIASDGGESAPG